jgi:hypothetical protein
MRVISKPPALSGGFFVRAHPAAGVFLFLIGMYFSRAAANARIILSITDLRVKSIYVNGTASTDEFKPYLGDARRTDAC